MSASVSAAGRIAGAAALIAVLTVASRLAGFGRTAVFTWVMGDQSDLGGMYVVANTIPNIIFEIVAGGAMASLVVPLLAGAVAAGDRAAVSATTGALLTWTLTLLVPLAVVVALLAGPIIGLIAGDRSPDEIAAGARMLRVFAPQLPLYGIGIVLTGVLQAHRRFSWPVIAPLLSSVTVITVYVTFAAMEGVRVSLAQVGRGGELFLAAGTTAGVVVLSLSLLIPLRGLHLRIRPGYAMPADARRRVGGLAAAGTVTVTAQQIALLAMLERVAAGPTGAPVVFNLAQAVFLLPWAVLAVPLAVASYPSLAAAYSAADEAGYRETLASTARRVLLLACLGAAALVATSAPVARFFWGDAPASSVAAIAGFAPGLLGYGLFALLTRALYARGANRPAAAATVAGWLVVPLAAVGLAAALPADFRVFAVGLANSAGMLVLGGLLIAAVAASAGRAALAGLARAGIVGVLAGILAATAGSAVAALPGLGAATPTKGGALGQGILAGAVVGLVFLAVAFLLDRHDVRPLVAAARSRAAALGRRVHRGGGGPAQAHEREGDSAR
ncbi:MAG TPA: lipid II flippase MurJ [Micromonosporaceae bacterium]|nr:lipid II flippase MurJ [Micromonosporaceae bacterium]